MTVVLWVVVAVFALLLVLAAVAYVLGTRMPVAHTTTVEAEIAAPVARVWAAVTDFAGQTAWLPGLRRVERLPDRDGHEVWREHVGPRPITLVVTERVEERRLVRTIVDEGGPFSGRWDLVLAPCAIGTRVTVTEHGNVRSPIARCVMAKTFGFDWFLRRYLGALSKHLA